MCLFDGCKGLAAMPDLPLTAARTISEAALAHARVLGLLPILVVVLDSRATVKCALAEDGTSTGRFAVAFGKANGALAMGVGSRALADRAKSLPSFFQALSGVIPGGMLPGPGGVLVRDASGATIGAVGISGDVGDNDERAAIAGIEAAGLIAAPGEP
jgi:uncharacterized protein GlcG (DUF336 family)